MRGPDLLAWPKLQEKSCSLSVDRQFSEQGVVQVGKERVHEVLVKCGHEFFVVTT